MFSYLTVTTLPLSNASVVPIASGALDLPLLPSEARTDCVAFGKAIRTTGSIKIPAAASAIGAHLDENRALICSFITNPFAILLMGFFPTHTQIPPKSSQLYIVIADTS